MLSSKPLHNTNNGEEMSENTLKHIKVFYSPLGAGGMLISSTILMIRPAAFGFNAETAVNNFFQSNPTDTQPGELQQKALKEFDAMVSLLRENEIEVIVIEDTAFPPKPDAVFPNNWFCTFPNGVISVFPMYAMSRREEKRDDILKQLATDYKVTDVQDWSEFEADGHYLEGTGSMLMDHENKIIYACLSQRTDEVLLEKFARTNGYGAITFSATDKEGHPIYHTNVMMCLGEKFSVICEEAIEDEPERIAVTQLLQSTGKKIIPITKDQMHAFAGNMLQVKNKNGESFLVMSATTFNVLNKEQIRSLKKFATLLPVHVPTIEKVEGGSVRCMMAEIFLEKK